jgi:hypothetical protein
VEDYKLRVVVDGSPNSLDETVLRTKRQRILEVKQMTKEMVWKIDQIQELFKYVEEAALGDTVFAVLGGNPADYVELWDDVKDGLQNGQDARQLIGAYLGAQIAAAIDLVKEYCGNDDPTFTKLMELFQGTEVFTKSTLVAQKIQQPTPDKVFRKVERDGVPVLIPASNAIGIVLKHGLTKKPSLEELEALIKKKM